MKKKIGIELRINKFVRSRCIVSLLLVVLVGCGTAKSGKKKDEFFTSGSREADQRASQTMAKHEQLSASGGGADEKNVKKAKSAETGKDGADSATNKAAQAEGKLALFDRLGGENGISNIVADFLPRALEDPRVNWQRQGMKRGGWFHRDRGDSVLWSATPGNVGNLKKHLIQFLALATGGPPQYDGKGMKSTHAGMKISNPEFDAAIGDLKASLDKLQIPNKEQKELLAIVESTRPEIVTQR